MSITWSSRECSAPRCWSRRQKPSVRGGRGGTWWCREPESWIIITNPRQDPKIPIQEPYNALDYQKLIPTRQKPRPFSTSITHPRQNDQYGNVVTIIISNPFSTLTPSWPKPRPYLAREVRISGNKAVRGRFFRCKYRKFKLIELGPLRIHFGAMKTGVNLRRIWQNSDGLSQFIFSSQFWPNVASWLFWQCQLMKEKQPPCWNSLRHAQPPVLQHFGQFGRLPKLALFHSYTVN